MKITQDEVRLFAELMDTLMGSLYLKTRSLRCIRKVSPYTVLPFFNANITTLYLETDVLEQGTIEVDDAGAV